MVVSTSRYSMTFNYNLFVKNCVVQNLVVNHSFNFLKVYKNTFADTVLVENSTFSSIPGSVITLDKEYEDLGIYIAEHVIVKNSKFEDIEGAVLNVYRGGTDESTFGPIVEVANNEFGNAGLGKRNKSGASMKFHGVQKLEISNNTISSSAPLELFLTNGEPITSIKDCKMVDTPKIRANNMDYTAENITYLKK